MEVEHDSGRSGEKSPEDIRIGGCDDGDAGAVQGVLRRLSPAPGSRSSQPPMRTSSALFSPDRLAVVLDLHGSVGPELEALPGYSGNRLVTSRATTDGRRVLIIVQNLSVPFDRRARARGVLPPGRRLRGVGGVPDGGGRRAARAAWTGSSSGGTHRRRDQTSFATYLYEFAYCWLWYCSASSCAPTARRGST